MRRYNSESQISSWSICEGVHSESTQISPWSIYEGLLILPSIQYQLIRSEIISESAESTREPIGKGKRLVEALNKAVKLYKSHKSFFCFCFCINIFFLQLTTINIHVFLFFTVFNTHIFLFFTVFHNFS